MAHPPFIYIGMTDERNKFLEDVSETKESIAKELIEQGEKTLAGKGYSWGNEKLAPITAIVATGLIAAFIQDSDISSQNASIAFLLAIFGLGALWLPFPWIHKKKGILASALDLAQEWQYFRERSLDNMRSLRAYFRKIHKKIIVRIQVSYALSAFLFLSSIIVLFVAGFVD